MMGWVAVIACYWTSATLLAHVPEPVVLTGGRAGWKRTVFFLHTYQSQYNVWWKDGVEKIGALMAHVPEPKFLHKGSVRFFGSGGGWISRVPAALLAEARRE
jgi:hypothetical protein